MYVPICVKRIIGKNIERCKLLVLICVIKVVKVEIIAKHLEYIILFLSVYSFNV